MGWENRPGGLYYYSKQRIGGRVVSFYVGNGAAARLAERHQEAKRCRRERLQAGKARLSAIDSDFKALCEQAGILAVQALEAAGFHRPNRGPWRKKRREKHSPHP